jgi:hypothetical protein
LFSCGAWGAAHLERRDCFLELRPKKGGNKDRQAVVHWGSSALCLLGFAVFV